MKLKITVLLVVSIFLSAASFYDGPTSYRIEIPMAFPPMLHSETADLTEEGVLLGKTLFYDKILSVDSSLSCASCHKPEFAFADRGVALNKGVSGREVLRNTPPLFNLAWHRRFFWDGRSETLQQQAIEVVSSHEEMNLSWSEALNEITSQKRYRRLFAEAYPNQEVDSLLVADALAQFQLTLISADSKYDKVLRGEAEFTKEEFEGFIFVNDQGMGNCLHCHTTDAHALGTNGSFANNGIDQGFADDQGVYGITLDKKDEGKFKVPSLRNLLFTAPYMHDGRFETLEEVLDFYSEDVNAHPFIDHQMNYFLREEPVFSEREKEVMLAFLKTLNDSSFVSNPSFRP
ncbi:MAG: cytochrome-c peroxidase [Flavobacteriales bacterium]|nr:cytochrome-c peroxidase [Flavobacteriales bacterium]